MLRRTSSGFVSAVLIIVFLSSFMVPGQAFYCPGSVPSDDAKFSSFGPMTPSLILKPFASQEEVYVAYRAEEIDFMDWSLNDTQLSELEALDPNMTSFARAKFVELGMREFDFNNMRFPTDDVAFRRALSRMFDKDAFVADQLDSWGIKMDSPLQNHGSWYNPYCSDLYPFNLTRAQADLTAAGYIDINADGWREGPAGQAVLLDVYIRSDDANRDAMGTVYCANLRACGVNVNEQHQPRSVCTIHVMRYPYDYNVYTGGWSFGRDPDILYSLYQSTYAQTFDGTTNYPGYHSATFDAAAVGMLTATSIGDQATPSTAIYHVWEMQRILMDDAAILPVFSYADYGAYKTSWNNVVNGNDVGPWAWFTFMSASKPGTDTIVWGQANDITNYNPIVSQWVWDWNLLNLVYDNLIHVNPYDPAQDLPWLAKSWTFGEWDFQGSPASTIEFKLREDVYWQDIAPKADRSTPNGAPLLRGGATNVKFTADDVVFTINTFQHLIDWWGGEALWDVVYAEKIDPYTVKLYMDLLMPLWSWHWIGEISMVPQHVWKPLIEEGTYRYFDTIAQQCLVGTGPWQFDYVASVMHSQYVLRANTRFFGYHPVDILLDMPNYKVVTPGATVGPISVIACNHDALRDPLPGGTIGVSITHTPYLGNAVIIAEFVIDVPLPFGEDVVVYTIAETQVEVGIWTWNAQLSADPVTGHDDSDGYTEYVYASIPEDINLDFFVNAKDAVALGVAFGSLPMGIGWNPACDINKDGYVNAKDAVKLGAAWGWTG